MAILPVITAAISSLPSLITAYKGVKKLDDVPALTKVPDGKVILSMTRQELNPHKLQTVVDWLIVEPKIKDWLGKYGLNRDDLRQLVNAACVIRKVINFKIKKRNRK